MKRKNQTNPKSAINIHNERFTHLLRMAIALLFSLFFTFIKPSVHGRLTELSTYVDKNRGSSRSARSLAGKRRAPTGRHFKIALR